MVQIIWRGNFLDYTGYSKATREYITAIHNLGIDVKLDPVVYKIPQIELPSEQSELFRHLIYKPKSYKRKIFIHHQTPDYWKRRLHPSIGFTYWETSKIPSHWVQHLNQMHGIFLSSNHNVELFQKSGVRVPLFHIRPCLSPIQSNSKVQPNLQTSPDYLKQLPEFRFLSVLSWINRKGYDLLLKAFWQEFSSKDNVSLIIKTVDPDANLKEIEKLKISYGISHNTAPLYIDTEVRSDAEMDQLYRNCQAFVLPSRGEGIGYPLLEAAQRGLPIIATGWGGHLDFLHDNNSFLIPYHFVPVKPQGFYPGYQPDQLWAEPSVEQLKVLMRNVYENYAHAVAKGKAAQQYVEQHYTHELAARDILSAIHHLTGMQLL